MINSVHISCFMFSVSILFYSTTPLILMLVVSLPVVVNYFFGAKVDATLLALLLFLIISLISVHAYFSIQETLRFASLSLLSFLAFLLGSYSSNRDRLIFILKFSFYSSIIVVLYYNFSMYILGNMVQSDGRTGYFARELLFFGRKYNFTLGITHLNIYTSFGVLFSLVTYFYKRNIYWLVWSLIFIFFSVLSESRGPLLFILMLFLSCFLVANYRNRNGGFFALVIISLIVFLFLFLGPMLWEHLKAVGHSGGNRVLTSAATDLSRFSFFELGLEHLYIAPFGNVLVYTSDSLLNNYHNTIITLANRNGIPAFLFFLCFFVLFLTKLVRFIKCELDDEYVYLIVGCFVYAFLYLNIEDVLRFDRFPYLLLFFIAGVVNQKVKYYKGIGNQ